jgi:hypothetical protein
MGNCHWRQIDEPQVGQRHEDVERNWEYYHIVISLKGLEILHQERRGQLKTIVMDHFNGILFHKSGPANKQHTNQSSINSRRNLKQDLQSFICIYSNSSISREIWITFTEKVLQILYFAVVLERTEGQGLPNTTGFISGDRVGRSSSWQHVESPSRFVLSRRGSSVQNSSYPHCTIFTVYPHTFILFWLRKTSASVKSIC